LPGVEKKILLGRVILETPISVNCDVSSGDFLAVQIVSKDDRSFSADDSVSWAI
jgi:hypothetical protein